MIDLHCHILPGLDDGAADAEESVTMIRQAAQGGTRIIAATPHCSSDDPQLPLRIRRIRDYVYYINRASQRLELPVSFLTGMELLCCGGLEGVLQREEYLPLGASRCLLIEFDFGLDDGAMEEAASLVQSFGCVPVLAHPERYDCIQRRPARIRDWFQRGFLIQVNKGSLLGRFGPAPERAADWILRNGLAHLVASDAHHSTVRTPDLSEVRLHIARRYSPEYADILLELNPRRILDGLSVLQPNEN